MMSTRSTRDVLRHIHARRAELRRAIDTRSSFAAWEESCVPSYCHPNLAAAYVSWWRLFRAVDLARRSHPAGQSVLDFGSSVGELAHLLPSSIGCYHFIEENPQAVAYLTQELPRATQVTLHGLPPAAYDWIFAIDSLEHNEDYAGLLRRLCAALTADGIMILSGPTENWLYRFGRRVAGFHGHYHRTTIFEIESAADQILRRLHTASILPGMPLFRLSVWARRLGVQ